MSRSYLRSRSELFLKERHHFVGREISRGGSIFNWFGNGEDGDHTITSNYSLPVVEDGDMAVKQYTSLFINSGYTYTTSHRCRGLLIYVQNDCTINGSISMSARGCRANPDISGTDAWTPVASSDGMAVSSNGLVIPMKTATGNETLLTPNAQGFGQPAVNVVSFHNSEGVGTNFGVGKGGSTSYCSGSSSTGNRGYCGGGNRGGAGGYSNGYYGRYGTCFSGGAGGGGGHYDRYTTISGSTGVIYGGAGGRGSYITGRYAGGGAGNPGGSYGGGSGTGGTLILIVGGKLTINGSVRSNGSSGGNRSSSSYSMGGGGGSGGGRVIILYRQIENNGSVSCNGGAGGEGYYPGGPGGNGAITIAQVL